MYLNNKNLFKEQEVNNIEVILLINLDMTNIVQAKTRQ